jgi:hypothetical protein
MNIARIRELTSFLILMADMYDQNIGKVFASELEDLLSKVAVDQDVESTDDRNIREVLSNLMVYVTDETMALDQDALAAKWFWQWEKDRSVEHNACEFNDDLEAYKRRCRKWEEYHNGSGCVVERVRSKYLVPRVREFLAALAAHAECDGINCNRVNDDEGMTCGDCDHLCGEECGHHGREVNADDLACDYFVAAST